ncbi:MBL fold metallo-hydrolase [Natranaeroarchaeum aerophilus]|uniref:MBL fold metallo-hydrolase n=1 Tax=Natranaeroarchaeum aerophilus TaxID=2917711 RepID=A0AAE3FNZ7_9EURY|nr:MBL fold metallo-hydrolase [Natranaeroarchaeum aerophilus]MCL9813007.1 MBL fold metallo-hydrolase [Natranaeroarchaeum aerophilus]
MFSRLSIPTPFQVGPVNAYLAGRTLIDPGPDSDEAWETLTEKLAAEDCQISDLERVVVTHPHPDHFGMAKRLHDRGINVIASPDAAEIIKAFDNRLEYEQSFFETFFVRHGLDRSTVDSVTTLPEAYLPYAPNCTVDRIAEDGDTLDIEETTLTVEAVDGHAPGELLFSYRAAGADRAIVGDHVLGDVTPNPLLRPPMEPDDERPRVLPSFNASLSHLRERAFEQLLPGHGGRIEAPTARIDEILAAHEDRTENVLALIDGKTSAREVMEGLFDDLPVTEYFPAMSEAVGHLDVLEARGKVRAIEEDGRTVYTER